MAKSQETFGKKEKEKKRLKKRKEKAEKREERKANAKGGNLEDMIVYLDEDGNFTDTPPDPKRKRKINAKTIEISVPKKTEEALPAIRNGRVEFFNDSKGFGFIKELDTQEKYFTHISNLIDEIAEGDMVTFEIERGMKGMNAVRVQKV